MGTIGPNAKVRVQGASRHDLISITWTMSKTKTPFTQIGDKEPDRYTAGPLEYTFSGEAQSGPTGAFAINWDLWCKEDQEHPLVCTTAGRTERLMGVIIDEVGSTIDNGDGTFKKSISGKFKSIAHE